MYLKMTKNKILKNFIFCKLERQIYLPPRLKNPDVRLSLHPAPDRA
jgi:hypothetical protein